MGSSRRAVVRAGCAVALVVAVASGCSSKQFTSGGAGGSSGAPPSGGSGGSGEPPANVQGTYMVSLTNRENSCETVMDWMVGAQATGVPLAVVQNGTELTANVEGLWGTWLTLYIGRSDFVGRIDGSAFTLTAYGTKPTTMGNCTMTQNAIIDGTLTGNAISGTVTYRPAFSSNPDCEAFDCEAIQEFSGSRPPPADG